MRLFVESRIKVVEEMDDLVVKFVFVLSCLFDCSRL